MSLDTERNTPEEMAELDTQVHLRHCNQGEYEDSCKYGEDDCPAQYFKTLDEQVDDLMEDLIMGHNFEYAGKAIKSLLIEAKIDGMQQAKSRVLRRTEVPADAKNPTRDVIVITGEECARIISQDIEELKEQIDAKS